MRLFHIIVVLFVLPVVPLSAQNTLEAVEFTVFRDRDSMTFIFNGNFSIPFHNIRIDAFAQNEAVNEFFLGEVFDTLNRRPIEAPTCLRLEGVSSTGYFPSQCEGLSSDQLRKYPLNENELFWINRVTRRHFSLEFFQGENFIGECRSDQDECIFTFVPTPMPIHQATIPPETIESELSTDIPPENSSFIGTNSSWQAVIASDFGVNLHDMVLVPPPPSGTVRIGANDLPNSPESEVAMTSYRIDRYEVSRGQYALCLSSGGCSEYPNAIIDPNVNVEPSLPRTGISPTGANEYCRWALGANGRLPNEHEWEYAAAGPDGWNYPWGNDPPNNQTGVIFGGNSGGNPVSIQQPGNDQSWVGARHMSGNIREIAGTQGVYVARGGDYNSSLAFIRIQFRTLPEYLDLDMDVTGFRCVLPVNP